MHFKDAGSLLITSYLAAIFHGYILTCVFWYKCFFKCTFLQLNNIEGILTTKTIKFIMVLNNVSHGLVLLGLLRLLLLNFASSLKFN